MKYFLVDHLLFASDATQVADINLRIFLSSRIFHPQLTSVVHSLVQAYYLSWFMLLFLLRKRNLLQWFLKKNVQIYQNIPITYNVFTINNIKL